MEDRNIFASMLQLIDVSSKRGAWAGSELEAVAAIRKAVVEKLKSLDEPVEESVEDLKAEPEKED